MSRVRRGAAWWLVPLLTALLSACAGTPDAAVSPSPEATPAPTEPATAPLPQPARPVEEAGVAVAALPPAETPPDAGTPIVVPTPRERAVQASLSEARGLVAAGDADSLRRALERLVRTEGGITGSEGITNPEGAALAATVLTAFRATAPERLPELIPALTRAHELAPPTADSYSALGRALFMVGSYEQAERAAAGGLTIDPLRVDLLLLRAQVLTATDRWLQARTPLESVLRAEPDNADALVLQATILWRYERDVRAATDVIQNAFATHPEDARFYELQGYILYDQGQREQARLVLRGLLERDPGRVEVTRFLLQDAVDRASWSEAAELLERLGKPVTAQELLLAQAVYRGLGDHVRDLQTAAELDGLAPDDRRYAPIRARSLFEAGEPAPALTVITAALAVARDKNVRSDLYYLRAVVAGEPFGENAVRDLQRALSENPANPDAMLAMARHFQAAGQSAKALQYARSALRYRPDDPGVIELLRLIESSVPTATPP